MTITEVKKIKLEKPIAMRSAITLIELHADEGTAHDFTDAISRSEWVPASSTSAFTAINSVTTGSASAATWQLEQTLAQDDATEGYLDFLNAHEGEQATIYAQLESSGQWRKSTVTLVAVQIGGTANGQIQTAQITMGSDKPVKIEDPRP